ncbi:hypothetical protein ASC64_17135 [Nocardioides sp. Root122]|uniref:hypothetical protein n=1 Tax=Nocardioides TaxID=1839 RepID=UPI0007030357|nr:MULTISPECIES: hypothetical protein [Nocardioides]KQV63324.1 hypothetical protein ASC64_17135 [Nocardioides sp. Root122]MCK9825941.1 hypothetical protein [Nocardioides cavernae]
MTDPWGKWWPIGRAKEVERLQAQARLRERLDAVESDITSIRSSLASAPPPSHDSSESGRSEKGAAERANWIAAVVCLASFIACIIAAYQASISKSEAAAAEDQARSAAKEAKIAQRQLTANQRQSDWGVVSGIQVNVDEDELRIDNRSKVALMSTGTWLVGDISGSRSLDMLLVEVNGIPACSAVTVPMESILSDVAVVPRYEFAPPTSKWPAFTGAYLFVNTPAGGLYSTSSSGGVVDHQQIRALRQSDPNYGSGNGPLPWDDPARIVWVPDTFWEFSEQQIGQVGRPLYAGAPLLGRSDGTSVESISCR